MTGLLASYWYYRKRDFTEVPGPLILDSGAFSAYTQNSSVDIKDLAKFYKRVADETEPGVLQWVISLDVLGEHEQSWRNWLELREMGVETVPVIHFTTPMAFEDQITPYLEAGAPRVCFGGMVGAVDAVNHWAAYGLRWLRDNSPETLTHGLGVGPWVKRARLPWDSTDCSDFGLAYRFGTALLPNPVKSRPISIRLGTGYPPSHSAAALIRSYGVDPRDCTSADPVVRIAALAQLSFRASEHEERLENARRAARSARAITRYVVDNQTHSDMREAAIVNAGGVSTSGRLVTRYVVDGNVHAQAIVFSEMRRSAELGSWIPTPVRGVIKPKQATRPARKS